MFTVRFKANEDLDVDVEREQSLFVLAKRAGAAGQHPCGGHGRCGTCRVRILEGADHLTPVGNTERAKLDSLGAASDERLACQAWARGPVTCCFSTSGTGHSKGK